MKPFKKNNQWLICQPKLESEIETQWFDQEHWLNQGRLLGANSGRGSAWVVKSEHGKWVLRHYFRGGMYAKISKDKYLWTGIENCRAIKEFKLLLQLQSWKLPAPVAVAARVIKHGCFYRNDLIMEQLQHQNTFAQSLSETDFSLKMWQHVGSIIAKFHNHGVFHSDLNANNILINDEQIYLIDFDKSDTRNPKRSWQLNNINRLKRSIEKITQKSCQNELKPFWDALYAAWELRLK
ncbi:3-deoxy-D-manno-octulosonic acid kinase [Marinicella rhabdoformis]|uniref:3-deoxy-D-manno-octulosonic acid kinase n=1 Tax=Marinicella rhabdoformis TaxID=2580566 RepID=UPI0015D09EA3|nr:3-deoxy-D-manno-octulosonic acid kinase [Marinicella rhabdoformis]